MQDERDNQSSSWVVLEEESVEDPQKAKKQLKQARKARKKQKRTRHGLRNGMIAAVSLVIVYCFLVFSHIPFKKLSAVMASENCSSCDCVIAYTAQAPL